MYGVEPMSPEVLYLWLKSAKNIHNFQHFNCNIAKLITSQPTQTGDISWPKKNAFPSKYEYFLNKKKYKYSHCQVNQSKSGNLWQVTMKHPTMQCGQLLSIKHISIPQWIPVSQSVIYYLISVGVDRVVALFPKFCYGFDFALCDTIHCWQIRYTWIRLLNDSFSYHNFF